MHPYVNVYIYPDEEQYEEPVSWKSDDYQVRISACCDKCGELLELAYQEPFASCSCGTQEWYK